MGFLNLFDNKSKPRLEEDNEKENSEELENGSAEEEGSMEDDEELYEVEVYIRDGKNIKLPIAVKEKAEKWAKDILNQIEANKKFVVVEILETEDGWYSYDAILASDVQCIDISHRTADK